MARGETPRGVSSPPHYPKGQPRIQHSDPDLHRRAVLRTEFLLFKVKREPTGLLHAQAGWRVWDVFGGGGGVRGVEFSRVSTALVVAVLRANAVRKALKQERASDPASVTHTQRSPPV